MTGEPNLGWDKGVSEDFTGPLHLLGLLASLPAPRTGLNRKALSRFCSHNNNKQCARHTWGRGVLPNCGRPCALSRALVLKEPLTQRSQCYCKQAANVSVFVL